MAQGVLAFVRGIDLTRREFESHEVPERVQDMASLRWLRLSHTTLTSLPDEVAKLKKLEHLHVAHNQLTKLNNALVDLSRLRTVNARYNALTDSGVPLQLFGLEELSTLDLSHNNLEKIPEELEDARGLQVLNLSHNNIKEIPKSLFVELNDLHHLDLSSNRLETIPPQLRRLHHLNTLILANNPLQQAKLRAVRQLNSLTVLKLANTQRNATNLPDILHEGAPNLQDLDLSRNEFSLVPATVYELTKLRRIDFSYNQITELTEQVEVWLDLQTFNFCHNKLTRLPGGICKLAKLKRLFVSDNSLTFDGLPSGIGRLVNLEAFMAARNHLQCIPDGLCRCTKLKRLVLNNNELLTLPEAVHFLRELEVLDVRYNPNLTMPAKPAVENNTQAAQFYNIDFSVDKLKSGITSSVAGLSSSGQRKAKIFARRNREKREAAEAKASIVLKGMAKMHGASERQRSLDSESQTLSPSSSTTSASIDERGQEPVRPKRWDETLEKPDLDYSDFFPPETGQLPGVTIWTIENFLPVMQDSAVQGYFYEGDCYIVLKTFVGENSVDVDWLIFFWCGKDATMDKLACAAIHSVNLRNMLGARCRTIREEQGDESDEFLQLFQGDLVYVQGGSASGFYTVEDMTYTTRLYRMWGAKTLHFEAVLPVAASLDLGFVFILDAGKEIFVWSGTKSSLMCRQKARLLAEKMNKNDRKDKSAVFVLPPNEGTPEFWKYLGGEPHEPVMQQIRDFNPPRPTLYRVVLGHGYLELPQAELPQRRLVHSVLQSTDVYILDCTSDVFVWIGRKSPRLVRRAALKLSTELCSMLPRRDGVLVNRVLEGTEPLVFKTKFSGWDDVMAVDYTRIPGFGKVLPKLKVDLEGTKSDSKAPAKGAMPKVDMSALFSSRLEPLPDEEALQLQEDYNLDLAEMKCFVLEGKKFVKLPPDEEGHFYSHDSYVFLCRYYVPKETEDDEDDDEVEEDLETTVYFWQGHNASKMGWLTFAFSFQKKIEQLIRDKLEVKRIYQQQESPRLLSHFKGKFIIHQGKRQDARNSTVRKPTLFHTRANGSLETTRTVEVPCTPASLNSEFCYVLRVPFENGGGIVYAWQGSCANKHHYNLIEDVAKSLCEEDFALQIIPEGREPENFFWVGLGGKGNYPRVAEFIRLSRLFRCSNDKGFFSVSEKCADFCQDDLADDDVMILDSGKEVFVWVGSQASDIESKLGAKSAQVYANYWHDQGQAKRTLRLVRSGKEPPEFTCCFHGWQRRKSR